MTPGNTQQFKAEQFIATLKVEFDLEEIIKIHDKYAMKLSLSLHSSYLN